ncbi:dual specificity protein phosphatase family protein [Rhizobium skierniewicense]|uniref:dual specificity protein phosphatase family protein n=1 Tax=Rhizobium skierniewicense TaxID=984260 RepID=UPI0015733B28|nr:dual specificity protein phosphatase family protein [Rhizobium skierniewicense]NTF31537.1 dual specificity protein phosphatase family protein [Rhizobium skierniewicense]
MIRYFWFRGILPLISAAAAIIIYIGVLQLSGNFHEVIAGQLYRSSQPSETQLADYVKSKGIRTIINLRGENENSEWYRDETATAAMLGVEHINFGMSARKQLGAERVAQLVQIMRDAPKPILIHCKSGSDRTGLASAIYMYRVAGMDEETAEQQLSIRFGHVSIPYLSSAYAMDRSWNEIEHGKYTTMNAPAAPPKVI